MASKEAYQRLKKELAAIKKSPPPYIDAAPIESNILEWHYVVLGPPGSHYEGGLYHGKLRFPTEYPFKPPSIYMITPSGRFNINTRLCLSISDFHPQSWKPVWSVASILTGLLSFMLEDTPTTGSIDSTTEVKKILAQKSWQTNLDNSTFREVFPELCLEMKSGRVMSLVPKTPGEEDKTKPVFNPLFARAQSSPNGPEKVVSIPASGAQPNRLPQGQAEKSLLLDLLKLIGFFLVLYVLYLYLIGRAAPDL